METADSWRGRESRARRVVRTQESMTPGTIDGRVAQASPVPDRTNRTIRRGGTELWVGDDAPPEGEGYVFWFDTNEPV